MKITLKFLEDHNACEDGVAFFKDNYEDGIEHKELILSLLDKDKPYYANWLITRLLDKEQRIKYAIFATELVLHIFEDEYPNDKRPRKAIEAAKNCLTNPSYENRGVAGDAANDSYAASKTVIAPAAVDYNSAHAAACAADAASLSISYSADSAYDACNIAASAAYDNECRNVISTYNSSIAAGNNIYRKSINYGLQLLEENESN